MMEATSTLADALLDDLDDLSDVEENNNLQEEQEAKKIGENGGKSNEATTNDVASFSRRRLLDDPSLQAHLEAVRKCDSSKPSSDRKQQEEMEHQLVVQSNKHLANLANEMARAHGDLCAAYKPKFPELEELVVDPIKYKSAVRVIGSEMDMTKSHVNDGLNEFLSSNQIITISVSSSTSTGRPLTPEELNTVDQAATYMEEISKVQQELTRFVESRMESLAPSVCVLIGPTVAANMLGLAGGLAELSRIPACNLQVLGQVKQNAASRAGLSSIATKPHTGILADCELVKSVPSYLQKKALKVVAAKLALVARFDYTNVDTGRTRSDSAGRRFREEIETKIASWQTQDKAPVLKALPKPDLTIKKRRGGKRMRRLKERYEETEMMKQANTRAFSVQTGEYGDDSMGLTMGMLDTTEGGGALRKTTEKRKMRQANTKASRKRAVQMAANASTSGLASSMVFTPVQGMELVNPDANKDRVREANKKWFSQDSGFQSALPKRK